MSASIVLCDVQLDDIRPERQKFITKFMKKKELEPLNDSQSDATFIQQSSNSMVDIVVRMKQDETFANLKVSSFDLILSLEFLLKIAQFIAVPDDGKPLAAPTPLATSSAITKRKWTILIEFNARSIN